MGERTKIVVLILFFLSGACSLVYQIAWTRMLVLVFGTSVFAVSTVLAAFMAGLGLGSALFGRLVDRRGRALEFYALLELGIGLAALILPVVFAGLDGLYTALYRQVQGSHYAFSLIRFFLSFCVLLVPTALMGATFPVLCKFAVRRLDQIGWTVGRFYAVNTFGAMVGCGVAAFALIEYVGVSGAVQIAAAGNLLIAAVAFLLSRREGTEEANADGPIEEAPEKGESLPAYVGWMVLAGYGLSGFAALGYEVVWTRLLAMLLQSATTQSLSTILIVFLGGLAAGGALGGWVVGRWRDTLAVFGILEMGIGIFGLASLWAFGLIPYIRLVMQPFSSWGAYLFRLFATAACVVLIPTLFMGILLPVVGKLHVRRLGRLGSRIGDVYAANTFGAIFGAFVTGFALIPALGTQQSLEALAWINVAIGATAILVNPSVELSVRLKRLGLLAVPVLALTFLIPSDLLMELFHWSEPDSALLYCDETAAGTVTVHQSRDGRRLLKVNGGGEVPDDYASIQTFRLLGNLPMLIHPDPREVLVIAFGGGITLAAVERHQPPQIDCVEVVPGVFAGARFFSRYNERIFARLDQPPLRIIADDGRNHVLRTARRYDVIIGDATHPGTADSWVLYTEEFYRLCKERLKEGGLIAQWLPMHGLAVEDYQMILRTFQRVFPHASLWLTQNYTVLLGASGPLRIDYERLAGRLAQRGVSAPLNQVDLGDPVAFLSTFVMGAEDMGGYAGAGRINTDDRPYISFTDRLRQRTEAGLPALVSLAPHLGKSVFPHLVGGDERVREQIEIRGTARRHTILGEIAREQGDYRQAGEEFSRALSLDPEERRAKRALQGLARR